MRSKSQITTLIVAIVLCAPAISAHAARRQSTQSSQVEREEETFVIRSEANGESICRNADANEHRRIINRSANEPARLIYPGAPRKSQLSLPETWTDLLSGLTLQPSAGLRIVLHGTSQLEQKSTGKERFYFGG